MIRSRTALTVDAFKRALESNLYYTRGQAIQTASLNDAYMTLGYTVRDHLVDRWQRTVNRYYEENPKFVCYLSAEYLLGGQLEKNLFYTGTTSLAREALASIKLDLDLLLQEDVEPGLGNGGLGRLAACFLDSMATLGIPSIAYGIRYEYGIFRQTIEDGRQVEGPDEWLLRGNPWEFPQSDDIVAVSFGGHTEHGTDADGNPRVRWIPANHVLGEPFHMLVPGYKSGTVNMLRLWSARASQEFDFQLFNVGDYTRAVEEKTRSESLSKVLYPNDNTPEGRSLRLRQQYFFVACSLQDIIRRFHIRNDDWDMLPEKVVIQLNDTHPVVAVAELMRLLVDEYRLPWEKAWDLTQRTFAYTCHTLLPEALETWHIDLFGEVLPRHLEIIYDINRRFLEAVTERFPDDVARMTRMSIIGEEPHKHVRMAHLAAVGSFSINGVARLQTELLQDFVLKDFADMWPEKFNNKTNGITPRRFVRLANPRLAELITSRIGDGWLTDLEEIRALEELVDDPAFRQSWREVKRHNKQKLVDFVAGHTGLHMSPDSMFDVMVKRIHEYKRQLLMVLHLITLYHRCLDGGDLHPRTVIVAGKAAPGYAMAKLVIKLFNDVARVVNADPCTQGRLQATFLPNFNVTLAERIYPAADLSEQISMAGKEASGTGNMKFALNGALTIGTLDGANIEIRERVGEANFFLFGHTADSAVALQARGYVPRRIYENNPELKRAVDAIAAGDFSGGDIERFGPIVDGLLNHDPYLVLEDYASYLEAQDAAEKAFRDGEAWTRMSILNAARCGFFSSDRTIREYAADIWKVDPIDLGITSDRPRT